MEVKAKSGKPDDLKRFLEQERQRLLREIAQGELTTDEERAGYSTHMADDATAVFEQARNVGLQRSHERMLAEVEDALARMDAGTYGICQRCGVRIDSARLRAMPTALCCLDCQDRRDHRAS